MPFFYQKKAHTTRWYFFILCALAFSFFLSSRSLKAAPTKHETKKTRRHAKAGHFDPTSTSWNGYSLFLAEAKKQNIAVALPKYWDWQRANINTPIVIIAPSNETLDIRPFKKFIKMGGRVFLANDFGAGERLWEAFGLAGYRLPIRPSLWSRKDIEQPLYMTKRLIFY